MNFPSIRLEGAILTADLLDAIAREDKHSQKPADFGLDPSTKVKDEIASTWASAKALWTGYQAKIANLHEGQTGVSETRNLFIIPLLALLAYQPEKAEAETVNGKSYAISHRDISRDSFPIHIMGWHDSLEKKRDTGGPRVSAHALVQEYLNLTEHSYGIITNGRQLRLLRDSSRLIKLSFLEFDLNRIFEEDLYADFAILFRLLHATRMPANRTHASASVIEKYHQDSVDSGSRIRDGLAAAVAYAMQTVANGLLAPGVNPELLDQLRKDPARANELHQNLLRWVYRTLFVLVIEERGLNHAPAATLRQRQLYRDYYSLQRLRRLADRPQLADRRAHDLWRAMHQTLRLYEDGGKGLPLGIAPLGSFLFREEGLQHLFQYQLDNRSLLQTLNRLSTFTHPDTNVRMRVNYGALDVEEFGSVYESLLELRPRIIPEGEKLTFSYAQLAGNERKTSGSYYTPDSLVQCLLDSALDPVIEERLAEAASGRAGSPSRPLSGDELRQAQEKALLAIKVCDPAVGSGHFLIGAAHRLAQRLADIRAGEEALSPDVQRHALRDVVSRCLYGVDINPLSVELCKVSLWMLGMEPGKPLGFLDHHIRCGNSLLGATPELIRGGIPEAAYDPIEGDDKAACSALKKQNKRENPKLGEMFIADEAVIRDKLFKAAAAIDDIGDAKPEDIQHKEAAFRNAQSNYDFQKAKVLADLWCAAFVIKKHFPGGASETSNLQSPAASLSAPTAIQTGLFGGTEETPKAKGKITKAPSRADSEIPIGITTQHLRDFAASGELPDGLLAEAKRLADQYQFFHWHLAFPEVFAQGGFDACLGNPPWDTLSPDQREFFGSWVVGLRSMSPEQQETEVERLLADPDIAPQWVAHCRNLFALVHFLKQSGFYTLFAPGNLGKGDFNIYRMFIELGLRNTRVGGCIAMVVPAGIYAGPNASAIRRFMLDECEFLNLFGLSNSKRGWFRKVDLSRFAAFGVKRGGRTSRFKVQFGLMSAADLSRPAVEIEADMIRAQDPETYAIPEVADAQALALGSKMRTGFPAFGDESAGPPHRHFLRELDMGNNRDLFNNDPEGIPLYEGRMVGQFDHRYKTYVAGHGNSSVWQERQFDDPAKAIVPQWRVLRSNIPERVGNRIDRFRIAFRDVAQPRDERSLIATIIPPGTICGHTVPTFVFDQDYEWAYLPWLAVADSFTLDALVRRRLSSPHLTFTVMDSLPFPRKALEDKWVQLVAPIVLRLVCTAPEMTPFWNTMANLGLVHAVPHGSIPPLALLQHDERAKARAQLDATVARDLFRVDRRDLTEVMETFPSLRRKEEKEFGEFRSKRLVLDAYDNLP